MCNKGPHSYSTWDTVVMWYVHKPLAYQYTPTACTLRPSRMCSLKLLSDEAGICFQQEKASDKLSVS